MAQHMRRLARFVQETILSSEGPRFENIAHLTSLGKVEKSEDIMISPRAEQARQTIRQKRTVDYRTTCIEDFKARFK